MLDIKFIRENKDIVAAGAKKKHIEIDLDRLLELDDKRKELQKSYDDRRAEQNKASEEIVKLAPDDRKEYIYKMADVKKAMQADETALEEVMKEYTVLPVRFCTIAKDEKKVIAAAQMALSERGFQVEAKYKFVPGRLVNFIVTQVEANK